jgi:general transcription factor 3C polypeptide 6
MMGDTAVAGHTEDSDYETDDECLIHVSVSGILQEDLSHLTSEQFSFLDIHSDRPLVTIGNQVFVGEYQDTVGTSVFFTQSENTTARDQVFSRKPGIEVKYFNSTRKKLVLKRVFLNKKNKPLKEKIGKPEQSDDTQTRDPSV